MTENKPTLHYTLLLILAFLILACGTIIQPQLPTLIPTAVRPAEEQTSGDEALALLPTFTTQAQEQLQTAGLTPGDPYRTVVATDTPPLPTRTPTRTATPTITPTQPPTFTPAATPTVNFQPTAVATEGSFMTRTPIPANNNTPTPRPWTDPTPHPYPISSVPRQGFAASLYSQDNLVLGQWRYSWYPYVPEGYNTLQHVPMISSRPSNGVPSVADVQLADSRTSHNYWLVFNECEHQGQCNTSPQTAADFFHNEVIDVLYTQGGDPDAKLIVGGVNAHQCGIRWLTDFITYYEANYGPLPHVGWHFHIYPEIEPPVCGGNWRFNDTLFPTPQAAFALWLEHANNALEFVQTYGEPTDEVWFTEIGCLNYGDHQVNGPICQAEGFMPTYASLILNWLNGEGRWVTRYAWYTDWTNKYYKVTMLLSDVYPPDYTGPLPLSALGQFYANIDAAASIPLPWP